MKIPHPPQLRIVLTFLVVLTLTVVSISGKIFAASNTCTYDHNCFLQKADCDPGKVCKDGSYYGTTFPGNCTGLAPIPCVTPGAPASAGNPVSYCAGNEGVETGIGCIPYTTDKFPIRMVQIVVGFVGGIAILLLVVGAAQYTSSQGDPDSIDEAKEKITAAVSGLVLIIFSILVLKIIGVDILNLPGFLGLPGGGLRVPST